MRAEIAARIEAVRKLRSEAAAQGHTLRAQVLRAERRTDLVLEAQRALNVKHDALRGEHDALATSTADELGSVQDKAAAQLKGAKEALQAQVVTVRDTLTERTQQLETLCQARY